MMFTSIIVLQALSSTLTSQYGELGCVCVATGPSAPYNRMGSACVFVMLVLRQSGAATTSKHGSHAVLLPVGPSSSNLSPRVTLLISCYSFL